MTGLNLPIPTLLLPTELIKSSITSSEGGCPAWSPLFQPVFLCSSHSGSGRPNSDTESSYKGKVSLQAPRLSNWVWQNRENENFLCDHPMTCAWLHGNYASHFGLLKLACLMYCLFFCFICDDYRNSHANQLTDIHYIITVFWFLQIDPLANGVYSLPLTIYSHLWAV